MDGNINAAEQLKLLKMFTECGFGVRDGDRIFEDFCTNGYGEYLTGVMEKLKKIKNRAKASRFVENRDLEKLKLILSYANKCGECLNNIYEYLQEPDSDFGD